MLCDVALVVAAKKIISDSVAMQTTSRWVTAAASAARSKKRSQKLAD